SQIEVDQQQVNLTRFSLFFPEKRDFFLENDGIFNFADQRVRNYRTGSGPRNFKLFHSRRIGLSASRQPVPIAAGARLTGRIGNFDLGFLNMQTEADQELPAENFTVLRLRRNILKSSDIGVMLTNRQATGQGRDAWNRAAGVDANLRVLGNMIVNSYFAVTDVPDASGNQQMAALQVAWRDPLWDTSFLLKTVGENFDPGIGFVSRRGIRQGFLTFGAHPQPRIKGIFEINPYVDVNVFTDSGWRLESREISPGLGVRFLNSSSLTLEISNRFERLADTTSIAGADVPAGEYDFTAVRLSYRSDSGKRLAGTLTLTHGDFFDGDRTSVSGSFAIRPSARVYFRGTFQHNRLRLGGQAFNADLVSARFNYGHNTRTFFSAFVQYIRAADELVTNLRFNLIHAPLSDIFLVYQDRRDLDTATAEPTLLDRALTLKVTKLFAF
ncbi:MAG: hypothetical protein ACE5I1_20330, partial [bacterium]